MQYARLGQTGLVVSRLAFGAMTFSRGNKEIASVYKVGASLADELVGAALDAGVNLFDTADAYAGGESESLLGTALKERRSQVVIATKVGFRTGEPLIQSGLTRRHILWPVDQSLKRLGTDWIDLYIVHREDPLTPHSRRCIPTGSSITPSTSRPHMRSASGHDEDDRYKRETT